MNCQPIVADHYPVPAPSVPAISFLSIRSQFAGSTSQVAFFRPPASTEGSKIALAKFRRYQNPDRRLSRPLDALNWAKMSNVQSLAC